MPVFPPHVVYNPPMSEQLSEPPTNLNFNETTLIHERIGTQKTNPIVEHYSQVQRGENSQSRPINLRFPNAVTTRISHPNNFFHQSTYEQSPNTSISDTIRFKNEEPINYANPNRDFYNHLISFLNWAKIPYDNKLHNFHMHTFYQQQHRIPEFMPPETRKKVETIKNSTRNMGRDTEHQKNCPQLNQIYSLTRKFLHNYNY